MMPKLLKKTLWFTYFGFIQLATRRDLPPWFDTIVAFYLFVATGEIPMRLSQLANLKELTLFGNKLTGEFLVNAVEGKV